MKKILLMIFLFMFSCIAAMAYNARMSVSEPKHYGARTYEPKVNIPPQRYYFTGSAKQRSEFLKGVFLKEVGIKPDDSGKMNVPKGYQIEYIVPLNEGGVDLPDNMRLVPIEVHK